MLLGVTGDQVLPADVYKQIKAETLTKVRDCSNDIKKEDQAQKIMYIFYRIYLRMMGDIKTYSLIMVYVTLFCFILGYHIAGRPNQFLSWHSL